MTENRSSEDTSRKEGEETIHAGEHGQDTEDRSEKESAKNNNAADTAGEKNSEKSSDDMIASLNDKYLRLYSEFDNYRKRTSRERVELIQTAGAEIIKELLPILDDFERAIKSNEKVEDADQLKQGFVLIHNKLLGILNRNGLEEMKSQDSEFDAELHEAITRIPAPTPDKVGKIVDVAEKGYYLNGKVLRYAKVVVGA